MKVLFVSSYKEKLPGHVTPFILEQAQALQLLNIEVDFFHIKGKGALGYLKTRKKLLQKIRSFPPDVIHAHYGLSGLLANLQRKIPVVTTYHGSDINQKNILRLSKIAMKLSACNIFVSQKLLDISSCSRKSTVLPCGIFPERFVEIDRKEAKKKIGLDPARDYILFSGAFDNAVKNYELAQTALDSCPELRLVELKGYTREEVVYLMNACSALLMTSHIEGSPQIIKEAMACNCPIVSVEVGDVPNMIASVDGCFIAKRTPQDIADKLKKSITYTRTNGRNIIDKWDNSLIAGELVSIYNSVKK